MRFFGIMRIMRSELNYAISHRRINSGSPDNTNFEVLAQKPTSAEIIEFFHFSVLLFYSSLSLVFNSLYLSRVHMLHLVNLISLERTKGQTVSYINHNCYHRLPS